MNPPPATDTHIVLQPYTYPCLDSTRGRQFGFYLHGDAGTEAAERGVRAVTTDSAGNRLPRRSS